MNVFVDGGPVLVVVVVVDAAPVVDVGLADVVDDGGGVSSSGHVLDNGQDKFGTVGSVTDEYHVTGYCNEPGCSRTCLPSLSCLPSAPCPPSCAMRSTTDAT